MTSRQYEILKTLAKFPGHKATRLRLVEERILGMLGVSYDVQILIRMGMIQPCFIFDFFAYQLTHKGASFIERQNPTRICQNCGTDERIGWHEVRDGVDSVVCHAGDDNDKVDF